MASVFLLDEGDTASAGKNSTYTAVWQTTGYATNTARRAAIVANPNYLASVTTVDNVLLDSVSWNYQRQAKNQRKVTLTYSHQENRRNKSQNKVLQNVNDEDISIRHASIEVPIFEAISQTKFGDSPDVGNRIEYNPQTREVKGTHRKKRVSTVTIKKIYAEATVDDAWTKTREDLMFTVNNATYRGRAAETVQYLGMSSLIQRSVNGDWEVHHEFETMRIETKDLTTLDIGSAETAQSIYPYRYYWASYEEEEDATAKVLVPKCKGFYESVIYDTADFSTIV